MRSVFLSSVEERFVIEGWAATPFWIAGCAGLALFVWGASMNLRALYKGARNQASASLAPVGLFGNFGLILLPVEGSSALSCWPLVIDIGTLAALTVIPPALVLYMVHEFWAKARRIFERVSDDDSPKPLSFYGQRIERDSESESDVHSER